MCGQEIGLLGAMSAHVKDKELGMFQFFPKFHLHMCSYIRAYIYPWIMPAMTSLNQIQINWLPWTSTFLRWPSYAVTLHPLIKPRFFGLTCIHLYHQHIVATYGYSQPCHVGKISCYPPSGCGISMQLIPHLVGRLLLLFVAVLMT